MVLVFGRLNKWILGMEGYWVNGYVFASLSLDESSGLRLFGEREISDFTFVGGVFCLSLSR